MNRYTFQITLNCKEKFDNIFFLFLINGNQNILDMEIPSILFPKSITYISKKKKSINKNQSVINDINRLQKKKKMSMD